MPDELDQDEINKLLNRILRGSKRVQRTAGDWIVPVGMPRFKGPGDAGEAVFYGLGRDSELEVDHPAQENLRVLALLLQSQLKSPEQADAHYVEREIMAAVGEVKSGAAKARGLGQRLSSSVAQRFARSVTIVPVGGLDFTGVQRVAKLGERVLLGPLNDATEAAFATFSEELTGDAFEFTDDVWWTEEILAYRDEPELLKTVGQVQARA